MIRTFFAIFIFGITLTSAVGSSTEKDSSAGDSPKVIKLQRFRKALWTVHVTVKGKEGDFLLDTGGGVTLLTEEFLKGMPCKFWGRSTGYNMFGKRGDGPHCDGVEISAGGVLLTSVNIGKISFEGQFPGDKAPDGLLSLDAFDGKVVTLDQAAATLTIETEKSLARRIKSMTQMPFRVSRECSGRCLSIFLGVPTPDGLTWLTLDSGAGGVSLIATEYAKSFGLDPTAKGQTLKSQAAPGVPIDSPVMVADMIMDGNLGQPFMSQYVITMDLAKERLWLTKATKM